MTQLMEVEVAEPNKEQFERERAMMNNVHYVMKYLLHDGQQLTDEMEDMALNVLGGVVKHNDANDVAKAAAHHIMSLVNIHRGNFEAAEFNARMAAEAANRGMFIEGFDRDVI